MFTLAKHRVGDAYRNIVGNLSATSTESKFIENGTLTPAEFLEAGDQLVFKFPTWQWDAGDSARRASYLEPDKQFLITRNVPCKDRVRALDYVLNHQTRTEGDWFLPQTNAEEDNSTGEIRDIDDMVMLSPQTDAEGSNNNSENDGAPLILAQDDFISAPADSGLPDFSELDAELAEDDPSMAPAFGGGAGYIVADAPDEQTVKTRSYDLSITYDKYYMVPRLWLFGYDAEGKPLTQDQVKEDVLSEYADKTVTFDPHPLTGIPTVSIHPCKHSLVMKKVVQDWLDQGIEPRHDLALFVFLKFISGVVPTINYDFTMDIEF
jgi:ubiquitin-like-conjugating enzyme ATG3